MLHAIVRLIEAEREASMRKKYEQKIICTYCGELARTRMVGGGPKMIDGICDNCAFNRLYSKMNQESNTKVLAPDNNK